MIDAVANILDEYLGAHSSVVLTYGVDLPLYDGYLRRKLRSAGVVNQLVFCDHGQYVAELEAVSVLRQFGVGYSVTPVHQAGAFHPKVYLLLGRSKGRLIVGSGNATPGGLLRNAEVFGVFEFDDANGAQPHPAFAQIVALVDELVANATSIVRRQWERARALSPWITRPSAGDGRSLLVGGPGRAPLLDQIRALVGDTRAREITVLSASFDRELAGVRALAELSDSPLRCIVARDEVNLDGGSVRSVGGGVRWHAFRDPRPVKKRLRGAARAHAKVIVFDRGDDEVVVYGSANASRPALLDGARRNTEVVVALPPRPSGTTVDALDLRPMLEGAEVSAALEAKHWDTEDEDAVTWPIVLSGVSVESGGLSICVAHERATPVALVLATAPGRPALASLSLSRERTTLRALTNGVPDEVRVAWIVDDAGVQLSNAVGLTWASAASASTSWGMSTRVEAAVLAMQDGEVLNSVLFDLLNQVSDFEFVLARREGAGGTTAPPPVETTPETPREAGAVPTEAFYTDAIATEDPTSWSGDRTDLDMLAMLVQPLSRKVRGTADEDDVDDTAVIEEAERRTLDIQKGKATGDERTSSGLVVGRTKLERDKRKLVRRLDMAACALEELLANPNPPSEVPVNALARQLWMMQIAAFLCGRKLQDAEGVEFCGLEPIDFARYTLRICRVLAGRPGRRSGAAADPRSVLDLVPATSWESHDGDMLRRGLAFAWTCARWSTAWMIQHWQRAPADEFALGFTDAVPELVLARFVHVLRGRCEGPDRHDLRRRLPASVELGEDRLDAVERRTTPITEAIQRSEVQPPALDPVCPLPGALSFGDFVYSRPTGISLFVRWVGVADAELLDLDKPTSELRRFKSGVITAADLRGARLTWRTPECLEGEEAEA